MDKIMLKDFFLNLTIVNFLILMFTSVMIFLLKEKVYLIHQKMYGPEKNDWYKLYIYFLATYKILIFIFCLSPLIALSI